MKKRRSRNAKGLAPLSALEIEVMGVVWKLGECSSAEVIAEFTSIRPLAPTTIRTVLSNLRGKGYLELVPTIERGYRFRATVARESVVRRSLKELLASLFQGSPRQAIAYLIRETFERVLERSTRDLGLRLVYDISYEALLDTSQSPAVDAKVVLTNTTSGY